MTTSCVCVCRLEEAAVLTYSPAVHPVVMAASCLLIMVAMVGYCGALRCDLLLLCWVKYTHYKDYTSLEGPPSTHRTHRILVRDTTDPRGHVSVCTGKS